MSAPNASICTRQPHLLMMPDVVVAVIVSWSLHLEIDFADNDVHDVAADPDFFAVLAQMDAAGALEDGALGRDIGRRGESCPDEPLREARVEAAGDRVFVSAVADERPHLEGRVVVDAMPANHA